MGERLIVFGAGGHAKVALEALVASRPGCEFAILDDAPHHASRALLGHFVVGGRDWLKDNWPEAEVFPAIGSNSARSALLDWLEDQGRRAASIIDPFARLSPSAIVAGGGCLGPGGGVKARGPT